MPLLQLQPFSTRRAIAHAVVTSIIRNETALETPEDVAGIFDLAHVLITDEKEGGLNGAPGPATPNAPGRPGSYSGLDTDEAEEQGWVARIVHLFKADTLDIQFEVCIAFLPVLRMCH